MNDEQLSVEEILKNSREAYEESRNSESGPLDIRILRVLARAGGIPNVKVDIEEYRKKLHDIVSDGFVWDLRGMGETSVRKLIEWLLDE